MKGEITGRTVYGEWQVLVVCPYCKNKHYHSWDGSKERTKRVSGCLAGDYKFVVDIEKPQ